MARTLRSYFDAKYSPKLIPFYFQVLDLLLHFIETLMRFNLK